MMEAYCAYKTIVLGGGAVNWATWFYTLPRKHHSKCPSLAIRRGWSHDFMQKSDVHKPSRSAKKDCVTQYKGATTVHLDYSRQQYAILNVCEKLWIIQDSSVPSWMFAKAGCPIMEAFGFGTKSKISRSIFEFARDFTIGQHSRSADTH